MAVAALNDETLSLLRMAAAASDKSEVTHLDVATSSVLTGRAIVKELSLIREALPIDDGEEAGTGAVSPPESVAAQAAVALQTADLKQVAEAARETGRMLCLELAELHQRLLVQGGMVRGHGELTGLEDAADHAYAFLHDGSRAMTGDLTLGGDIQMGASTSRTFIGSTVPVFALFGGPSDSYVNSLSVVNAVDGAPAMPAMGAGGLSDDINVNLIPKGAGRVSDNGVTIPTISSTDTLTNKTLTTPTIGDMTNAQHDHADAAGGGALSIDQLLAKLRKKLWSYEHWAPAVDDEYEFGPVPVACTITELYSVVEGGTNITYQMWRCAKATPWTHGTEVTDGAQTATTTGAADSTNTTTLAEGDCLRVKIISVSGSVNKVRIQIAATANIA